MRSCALLVPLAVAVGCPSEPLPPPHELAADFGGGVPFVTVELDGRPARCLYDTGSTSLFVSETWAGGPVGTVLDDLVTKAAGVALLTAGANVLEDGALSAIGSFDPTGAPLDCILGGEVTAPLRFTVDAAAGVLLFDDPNGGFARPPLDDVPTLAALPGAAVFVGPASIEGIDGTFLFDTGFGITHLQPSLFGELANPPSTSPILVATPSGAVRGEAGRGLAAGIDSFEADDVAFVTYDNLVLTALGDDIGRAVDGVIGASVLLRAKVTFDGPNQVVQLEPYADDVAAALVADLYAELDL